MNNILITKMQNNTVQYSKQGIINMAVTIFQNVGIKRWIEHIQSLMNEQIYFQICKIIFPESENMIKIFKISESCASTGQKIQEIIDMISRIIRLDLYHISGREIAEGNLDHLVNWLQLLQALSNNCVENFPVEQMVTEPQRDRSEIMYTNEDYYTVIGMENQFSRNTFENQKESETETEQVLKPISPEKNQSKKKKVKKVTFKNNSAKKSSKTQSKPLTNEQTNVNMSESTWYSAQKMRKKMEYPFQKKKTKQDYFLDKKKDYITKMHRIMEEVKRKQIYDQNFNFEMWTKQENKKMIQEFQQIEQEDRERKQRVNQHIASRQQIEKSLLGKKEATVAMKRMFKQQKATHKRMKNYMMKRQIEEANELMDLHFAANLYKKIHQIS